MSVTMRKSGSKDCQVNEDAVSAFEADGWRCVDGNDSPAEAVPVDDSGDGMTDAEKQTEIEAACKLVRTDGEAKGLTDDEVNADVEAERARITEALG